MVFGGDVSLSPYHKEAHRLIYVEGVIHRDVLLQVTLITVFLGGKSSLFLFFIENY